MQATLFFDESDVTTTVRLRTNARQHSPQAQQQVVQHPAAEPACTSFRGRLGCSGTVAVPSVKATLVWWLDQEAAQVHVLATTNEPGSIGYGCRKLCVDVPAPRCSILACGLSLTSDATFAVTWATSQLSVGFAMFRVQRGSDGHSTLLLAQEGRVTVTDALKGVRNAFIHGAGECVDSWGQDYPSGEERGRSYVNPAAFQAGPQWRRADPDGDEVDSDEAGASCGRGALPEAVAARVQACVLSEPRCQGMVATVYFTDGLSVWIVDVDGDGVNAKETEAGDWLYDQLLGQLDFMGLLESGRRCSHEGGVAGQSWGLFSRFTSKLREPATNGCITGKGKDRLLSAAGVAASLSTEAARSVLLPLSPERQPCFLLAISPIQNSQLVAITRWDGVMLVTDALLRPITANTVSRLRVDAGLLGQSHRYAQWSQLESSGLVHVVLSMDTPSASMCVWARLQCPTPVAISWGRSSAEPAASLWCDMAVVTAPTAKAVAVSCTTFGQEATSIAVLWDLGYALHVEGEERRPELPLSVAALTYSSQGITNALQWCRRSRGALGEVDFSDTFLCQSNPIHGVGSVAGTLILLEKMQECSRAHVVVPMNWAHAVSSRGAAEPCYYGGHREAAESMASPASSGEGRVANVAESMCSLSTLQRDVEHCWSWGVYDSVLPSASLPLQPVHLVPLSGPTGEAWGCRGAVTACDSASAFTEGTAMVSSHESGPSTLANLIVDVVLNSLVGANLGSFQMLHSAATLSGYVPQIDIKEQHMREALRLALGARSSLAPVQVFCSFSRRYIQHAVAADLLTRIGYLVVSHLGWVGAGKDHITSPVLLLVRRALAVLGAAYHAVVAAGPLLMTLTGELRATLVGDIVDMFIRSAASSGDPGSVGASCFADEAAHASPREEVRADYVSGVTVALRLRQLRGTSSSMAGMAACTTWCKALLRTIPLLGHFIVLHDVESCRTTRGSQWRQLIDSVAQQLAQLPPATAAALLVDHGFLLMGLDPTSGPLGATQHLLPTASTPSRDPWAPVNQWSDFVKYCCRAGEAANLYRVGWLRRLTPLQQPDCCGVDGPLVRQYFLTAALQLEHAVGDGEDRGSPATALGGAAIASVVADAMLFLARGHIGIGAFNSAFHYISTALKRARPLRSSGLCTEQVSRLISEAVEVAFVEQLTEAQPLESIIVDSPEVCDMVSEAMLRWLYRVPVAESSGELSWKHWMGNVMRLYRFLLSRGAYGQAAGAVSDLATLVRTRYGNSLASHATVCHLAALAVAAAELISDAMPLGSGNSSSADAAGSASLADTPAPHGMEAVARRSLLVGVTGKQSLFRVPLSSTSLPVLRRRLFQAHCESWLLSVGYRLDTVDLWEENAQHHAFAAAVRRMLVALSEHHLWTEARRFAELSGGDVVAVLCAEARYLVTHPSSWQSDATHDQWKELVCACRAHSGVHDNFAGLRHALFTCYTEGYHNTFPGLEEALCDLNVYAFIDVLLLAHETLMATLQAPQSGEAQHQAGETSKVCGGHALSTEALELRNAASWGVIGEALVAGRSVLLIASAPGEAAQPSASTLSAGILDRLTVKARDIVSCHRPSTASSAAVAESQRAAQAFLKELASWEKRLSHFCPQ